jgi:hypothetical protein
MKNKLTILIVVILIAALPHTAAFADEKDANTAAFNQFKELMANWYIYYDYKNVDWDALYEKYEEKIVNSKNRDLFSRYLSDLMKEVKDSHLYVKGLSGYRPDRLKPNYNLDAIQMIVGDFRNLNSVVSIGRRSKIGYIMIKTWKEAESDHLKILDGLLAREFKENPKVRFKDTNGLIIDLRMNSGGSTRYGTILLRQLTNQRVLAGYISSLHYPLNTSHDDNKTPVKNPKLIQNEPVYIRGITNSYTKPVIVLMGNESASAAEDFILYSRSLPNVTTMGDQSWGTSGFPKEHALMNGVKLMIPMRNLLDLNGNTIEDNPLQPNINVPFVRNNNDNVLKAAFEKFGIITYP